MTDRSPTKTPPKPVTKSTEPEYTVTFKKGALEQLQDAARSLGLPDDQLGEALFKGLKFIQLAKGGKVIIDKPDEKLEVDLKRL